MKKNDIVEITIEDMSDEGLGIGHADGMALFVKDTVTGDRVRAKVVKVKKAYAYARTEQVLMPGACRTKPVCPVAVPCGGCQIQEMNYEVQLRMKEQKVRSCLTRIGGFHIDDDRILTDELSEGSCRDGSRERQGTFYPILGMKYPWRYRNKAQFPIGTGRDGRLAAGFYAGRTHSIIDHHQCEIGIEENRTVLETVLEWMNRYRISAYCEESGEGIVRHVMTRAGFATGELMVVIIAAADRLPQEEQLTKMLKDALQGIGPGSFRLTSLVLNVNKARTNVILGSKSRSLSGEDYIEDRIGDITYRISSKSFYQVNPYQTGKLYETALEYAQLTGRETVWDLYCGIGTISLFLAQKARKVIGVEIVPDAILNAKKNAELNHIDNCEFIVGKAEDRVGDMEAADVIVVDPPRKGLDRIVTEAILRSSPDRIVYVSCNCATLARDLKRFAEGGYQLRKVRPVDMFPHTVHVETVCLLSQRKPDTTIEVDLDISELEVSSAETKATYEEIKSYVLEKHGLKVSNLYIAQVKRECGIIERENFNLPKTEGNRIPECPENKRKAIKEAFTHFHMI